MIGQVGTFYCYLSVGLGGSYSYLVAYNTITIQSTAYTNVPIFTGLTLYGYTAYYLTVTMPYNSGVNAAWSFDAGGSYTSWDFVWELGGYGQISGEYWGSPNYGWPPYSTGNQCVTQLGMLVTSAPDSAGSLNCAYCQSPCTQCVGGYYLYSDGSCQSTPPTCSAGWYQANTPSSNTPIVCYECGPGSWSPAGYTYCIPCSPGTASGYWGAYASYFCGACSPGYYSGSGSLEFV